MQLKSNSKSAQYIRILAAFVGVLLLLLVVSNIVISAIAEKQFRKLISDNPISGYHMTFDQVHINLLTMSVVVKGLVISPSGDPHSRNVKGRYRPYIDMKFPVLRFRFINVVSILFGGGDLHVGQVLYNRGLITLHADEDVLKKKHSKEIWKRKNILSDIRTTGFNSLRFDKIKLKNMSYFWVVPGSNDTLVQTKNLDIILKHLNFVRKDSVRSMLFLDSQELNYSVKGERLGLTVGGYRLLLSDFSVNDEENRIQLGQLILNPIKDRFVMAAESKFRKSVFSVKAKRGQS